MYGLEKNNEAQMRPSSGTLKSPIVFCTELYAWRVLLTRHMSRAVGDRDLDVEVDGASEHGQAVGEPCQI